MITVERIEYYKPRWHDEMLVFALVLSGSIDASIGCDTYRMEKDDIMLIGTEDVHSFKKTGEDNIVLFARFDCRVLEHNFPGITSWNFTGNPEAEKQNKADFDRLRFLIAETALGGNELSLLKYCRDTFLPTNLLLRKQDITPEQMDTFNKLDLYIHEKYREPLSLGDVSEFINYSLDDTSFLIKLITGMSFTDFLNHIRCLAAERMLVSTENSLTETASDCGFSDSRAFGRYFKKWYLKTPGEYRSVIKKEFPGPHLSKYTEIDPTDKKIVKLLESYIDNDSRTITLDLAKLPAGIKFNRPGLGITDSRVSNDGYDAITALIVGMIEGKIRKLKQTDDEGEAVFHGDCGLVTYSGIRKSVFYIYEFISGINTVLKNEDGIFIGTGDKGLNILLYPSAGQNFDKQCRIRLIFQSAEADYIIKRYMLDDIHGNPHKLWMDLGSPKTLSPEMETLIINHSLPELRLSVVQNRNSFELNEQLPAEGAVMIKIENMI